MTAEIDSRPSIRHLRPRERLSARPASDVPSPMAVPVVAGPPAGHGIEATAPNLRLLFEEAAAALIRLDPHPEASGPACRWESVALRAHDIQDLAGLWLDRLISLGDGRFSDLRREAIVAVVVDRVASPEEDPLAGRWQLRARVGLRPYLESGTRRRPDIRSSSDRPLAVERDDASWTLRASLAY